MANIPITGIPSNFRIPGGFVEILFAQGPASSAVGVREAVIAMPKLSGGSATAATLTGPIRDEQHMIDLSGAGSPAHIAARAFLRVNPNAKLWYLAVAETTGGTPAKADLDVTFATNPTASGTAEVFVGGEAVQFGYTSTDTPTTVADGIVAAVGAKAHLPINATNVAGVVTLEAKLNGISQGDGTSGAIRVHVKVTDGTAITVVTENGGTTDALGLGTGTPGGEGTTTEAASLATALTSIDNVRKYYIMSSAWDSTSLGNLKTHVTNKSTPNPGLRSVAITAFAGTVAAASTLATAQNYERLQLVWQPKSEHHPATLVGNVGGARQLLEERDPTANLASFTDWNLLPPFDPADIPNDTDTNDSINDGITVIGVNGQGNRALLVMSLNTRSKDSGGSNDDFRATETHRISGADQFSDELLQKFVTNFQGAKLVKTQTLLNGTPDPNRRLKNGVIDADAFKPWIRDLMDEFGERTILQDVATSQASLRVSRDPQNASRLESSMDLHIVDHLHQFTAAIAEVSEG